MKEEFKPILVKRGEYIWLSADYPDHGAKAGYMGFSLADQQLHDKTLFVIMSLPCDITDTDRLFIDKRVLLPVSIINVWREVGGEEKEMKAHAPEDS